MKTDPSTRWPCPVCLGVTMEKVTLGRRRQLQLDHCRRCGGVWLELGEVTGLRGFRAEALWARIPSRPDISRAQCHSCHTPIERNLDCCPGCGASVCFACPSCDRTMETVRHDDLTLDVCRQCRGVWFDHHEIAAIWKLEKDSIVKKHGGKSPPADKPNDGPLILLDVLGHSPEVAFYGAQATGEVLSASAEVLGAAPEIAGPALEVAGEVAASVFEVIVEIVAGIFS